MPLCWNWRIESGVPTATLFGRGNLVFPKSFIVCAVNLANIQSRWSRWLPLTCVAFRGSIAFYDLLIFWPGGYRVVLAASNSCPPAAGWMEWKSKPGHNFCGRDQSFRFTAFTMVSSACLSIEKTDRVLLIVLRTVPISDFRRVSFITWNGYRKLKRIIFIRF